MHRRSRPVVAALLTALALPALADTASLDFSRAPTGTAPPAGWQRYTMSRHKPPAAVMVETQDGRSVVHIDADRSAGAIVDRFRASPQATLTWRWKIDHTVAKGNLAKRSGDDFAARVYVFFDVPTRQLSFGQRMTLSIARHLTGENLPAAAICYVWDNHHAIGTVAPNPFYAPVRTVVIESGNGKAGQWVSESRDLAADYRKAFGRDPPPITGVAIAADTDNTRTRANAWFDDLRFTPTAGAGTQ
ncbi:MAG TPA: DUF3047 domain-containing protein [Dyella sp.]|nr:DUF3047 domain-containing protein [Dyella sp.]